MTLPSGPAPVVPHPPIADAVAQAPAPTAEQLRWLRYTVEATDDIVAVLAADGTLLHTSGSDAHHLGHAPEVYMGGPAASLLHPDDAVRFTRIAWRAMRRPGSVAHAVGRLRGAEGSWRSFQLMVTARRSDAGCELVVRARDLTPIEQLEQQLHRARALQVVGQTTASLVHDFSNLMVLIRCGAEMALLKLPADSDVRHDVEALAAAGRNAARLAGQILHFASGNAAAEGPTPVNQVIGELLPVLERAFNAGRVRVETVLHPNVGSSALGAAQIQQVLVNLALNARDAMPNGGVLSIFTDRVRITSPVLPPCPSTLRAGTYLRIEVSDTGEGMDEQTRMRVFDTFFTTKAEGTGLGLHVIRSIVERYGGCIWVESRKGAGSNFTVLLPEHAPAAATESASEGITALYDHASAGSAAAAPFVVAAARVAGS